MKFLCQCRHSCTRICSHVDLTEPDPYMFVNQQVLCFSLVQDHVDQSVGVLQLDVHRLRVVFVSSGCSAEFLRVDLKHEATCSWSLWPLTFFLYHLLKCAGRSPDVFLRDQNSLKIETQGEFNPLCHFTSSPSWGEGQEYCSSTSVL